MGLVDVSALTSMRCPNSPLMISTRALSPSFLLTDLSLQSFDAPLEFVVFVLQGH
jgi:hypothetical protein